MKKDFTLSKKFLSFALVCLALGFGLNAQNIVTGGDMSLDADYEWVMGWRNGSADQSNVEFGVTTDVPAGAISGTAAAIDFSSSGWNETQIWQVVNLTAGVEYFLNAKLKITIPELNTWVQGFILPYVEPGLPDQNAVEDAQLITSIQLLQVNDFTSSSDQVQVIDGDFPKNVAASDKFAAGESFTPDTNGDHYVLFKFGGGADPQHCTITDVVLSAGTTSILDTQPNVFKVFPSNANEYIKVSGITNVANTEIYNMSGMLMSSKNVKNVERIDISSLSSGLYFIQVEEGGNKSTQKFIKQ